MARRPLHTIQVEVTSRCTATCAVCPRTALAERWLDGDLSRQAWEVLRPDLVLARHIHLQGWGEPLLHPRLRTMVADAHAAGCRVGITSNGELLDRHRGWIIADGVDVLTLSMAGIGPANARLRGGVEGSRIFETLRLVALHRGRRRRPRLHIAFLLTRDNATELPEVVRAAAEAGIDAVLVNHLDSTPTRQLRKLAAFRGNGVDPSTRASLEAAARTARRLHLDLRLPALEPQEMLVCDLDPRRIVSVRWDGRVAPCVNLNLPIEGPTPRNTAEEELDVEPPVYGQLSDSSLSHMLGGEGFTAFVKPFRRRVAADRHYREWGLVASGWGVVGLRDLDAAYDKLEGALAENPFPSACAGCPKRAGW